MTINSFTYIIAVFKDVWDKKLELFKDDKACPKDELLKLDKQIDDFLGRITELFEKRFETPKNSLFSMQ